MVISGKSSEEDLPATSDRFTFTRIIDSVDIGAPLDELEDPLGVASDGRHVQGRLPPLIPLGHAPAPGGGHHGGSEPLRGGAGVPWCVGAAGTHRGREVGCVAGAVVQRLV